MGGSAAPKLTWKLPHDCQPGRQGWTVPMCARQPRTHPSINLHSECKIISICLVWPPVMGLSWTGLFICVCGVQIVRLLGKIPRLAALAYHKASGRTPASPNQRLGWVWELILGSAFRMQWDGLSSLCLAASPYVATAQNEIVPLCPACCLCHAAVPRHKHDV